MTKRIKIVTNKYVTPTGLMVSYGVWVNGVPRRTFYSKDKLDAYVRSLNGK